MFVRDFIHVGQPFAVVGPRFVSDTSWLAPIAEEAALVARDVATSLTPTGPDVEHRSTGSAGRRPDGRPRGRDGLPGASPRVVRCEVGPVRARADGIVVPMWLLGVNGAAPLPDLTGDLEVAPVGADTTLLALGATYRRTTGERDELRRVEAATEAGVRTFLNGIAGFVRRPVSTV